MKTFTFCLVCIIILAGHNLAQTTYTLVSNGDWDIPSKWSPQGVPGPNDFIIVNDRSLEIRQSHEVAGFSFNDAGFYFKDSNLVLTVTDSAVWYGGEIDGDNITANNTILIKQGALLVLDSDSLQPESHRLYEGTTLINRGTIRHIGITGLGIRGNSVLYNESVYDIQSDADFGGESFSGGKFVNTGVFRKSGGNDVSSFNLWWVFENSGGTIEAKSGIIEFSCDGTFINSTLNADDGATISFDSGAHLFKGKIKGTPAGTVRLSDATINIDSSGVELNFTGKGFQWDAGFFSGGGIITIPEGAVLVLNGTSENPVLSGGTVILNKGTIRQEGNRNLSIRGGSVIENLSLFEVTTDAGFTGGPGSGGTFVNKGTLLKSGGDSITFFNLWWNFLNEGGNIEAKTGVINFTSSSVFTGGNMNAEAGAVISFTGGEHLFKGRINGSPDGVVKLSDATINIDSTGAELNFTGTGFQWDAGYFSDGILTIPEGALLIVNGMLENPQLYNATLLNKGTVRMEGSRNITARGGTINNQSLFEIVTDAGLTGGPGAGGTFINSGILRKRGGSEKTFINSWWGFRNLNGGVIEADSATIELYSMESVEGSVITGTSIIDVPGSFVNNGITSPGNSAGSLSYIGDFNLSETSILDIELGGYTPITQYDQLFVTGKSNLNGTLKVSLINGFVPVRGDTFVVVSSSGTIADSFAIISSIQGLYISTKISPTYIVVVIDSVGTIVSVEDNAPELATAFKLEQNFPNPFNPTTNIKFAITEYNFVKLEIFNSIGESIELLVNEALTPGIHNYKWDASKYASGVYYYSITTGSNRQSRKMLLLK